MTFRRSLPLARACLAAATLAACGQAFSAGTGVDAGPSDSAGGDGVVPDGSHSDGGGADALSDASHADSTGGPDAPQPPDASSDGVTGHDAISGDAIPGDAIALDVIGSTSKRIFVSSASYSGNLGGLAGADTTCQQLANKAALGGTYKAWLSSTATTASARLTHAAVPYALVNGVPVATNWAGLTSGTLLAPINVNESGGPPPTQAQFCGQTNASVVWTSTSAAGLLGTAVGATCSDWTSSGTTNGAVLGFADRTDVGWTSGCSSQGAGSTICGGSASLYCVEQ